MCTILLPIKPEYSKKIIEKTKMYEYRKRACKRKVDKIIIYSTAPIKKVIAEVEVVDILLNDPKTLWKLTKNLAGISKDKYKKYYKNTKTAIAYKLGSVKVYDSPKELKELGINYYPQSYVYLE